MKQRTTRKQTTQTTGQNTRAVVGKAVNRVRWTAIMVRVTVALHCAAIVPALPLVGMSYIAHATLVSKINPFSPLWALDKGVIIYTWKTRQQNKRSKITSNGSIH